MAAGARRACASRWLAYGNKLDQHVSWLGACHTDDYQSNRVRSARHTAGNVAEGSFGGVFRQVDECAPLDAFNVRAHGFACSRRVARGEGLENG